MTPTPTRSPTAPVPSVRLGRRTRKAVLVTHIAAAGTWIGIDVVLAVFVLTSLLTDDPQTEAVALQALGYFAVWPLLAAGLLCLVTGIVLGIGTKYGLVRFRWVAVKLALNIALTGLVLLLLRPGIAEVSQAGREMLEGRDVSVDVGQMLFPPFVSLTALVVAVVLSVYKPWGRLRRRSD